jgi:prepilin-type N-terminal cleavage/methylation domain-containing protein
MVMAMRIKKPFSSGFTLVELLVVIAIIGIAVACGPGGARSGAAFELFQ